MTITKMFIRIELNVIASLAAIVAALVIFFDVHPASAFRGHGVSSGPILAFNGNRPGNGGPSGPPPSRRGEGNYRPDSPRGDHRSDPRPGPYQGDRGPRFYHGQPFSPYGGPQRGGYGERRAVQSRGDAQRILNDYYMRRNMRIGPIRENRFYFEADILDRNNKFIDRVIIDKRSGRIRSVY